VGWSFLSNTGHW
jgi:hypothetical protein